jgi:hypothetical protein
MQANFDAANVPNLDVGPHNWKPCSLDAIARGMWSTNLWLVSVVKKMPVDGVRSIDGPYFAAIQRFSNDHPSGSV